MAEAEKLEVGGLTFDTAAIDALLDDAPDATAAKPDELPDEPAEESDAGEDGDPREKSSEDISDEDVPEAQEVAEEDDAGGVEDTEADSDVDVEITADFIADGDEGPMLLTGMDDKGEPIYETADELFSDHKFKIKAAGAEHEVTFDEMRKGYQRQVDYTKAKTQISETQRAMQPYIALLTLWEKDGDFKNAVNNYIEGVKQETVTDEDIVKAGEEGDQDKLKALLAKRGKLSQRQKAMNAANTAAQDQQRQFATQQHEIATSLIPNYNDTVQGIKTLLTNLGYGEHEVNGFEYLDARLQNLAYLAYQQTNPDSKQPASKKPGKRILQSKKRIVKRPPKAVKSSAGQSNTPKARSERKAKSAFQKAYKTGKTDDMVSAIASVLPDDLLED